MFERARALSLLYLAVSGCTLPATPTADVVSVRLTGLGWASQRIAVTLCVTNPNPDPLVFRSVSLDLDLAGAPVASGRSTAAVRLPAQSSTRVPFEVRTAVANLGAAVAQVATEGYVQYRLHGLVALDGALALTIPYSRSGHVGLADAATLAASDSAAPSRCADSDLPVPL